MWWRDGGDYQPTWNKDDAFHSLYLLASRVDHLYSVADPLAYPSRGLSV